ncbi:alpha-2A adrenergic receptor [Hemiscyllium ocellatum]|uniref:alpha-2A adrenergic receptor n=1 Tax=Hemiscyllium ocellatum TaxID=170820 RepID=UPI00296721E7|nr:alpha-2A adrenergic receptor [Hemiscyllium ocellatum]
MDGGGAGLLAAAVRPGRPDLVLFQRDTVELGLDAGGSRCGSGAGGCGNRSELLAYPLREALVLSSVVALLMALTIFGNVLVIIAVFTSRALRAPQNLFLVSLATADILVATLVMPFSLAKELMGYWYFGRLWCQVHLAFDVLFCTASIAHLCAISLDRYWSISQAIEYNLKRTPRRIKGIIGMVWVIAAAISCPPLITNTHQELDSNICDINDQVWYIISSCIGSFFAPCIIMILVYIRIYQIAKLRNRGRPRDTHNGLSPPPFRPSAPEPGQQNTAGGGGTVLAEGEDSSSSEQPPCPALAPSPSPAAARQHSHPPQPRHTAAAGSPAKARGQVRCVDGRPVSSVAPRSPGPSPGPWPASSSKSGRWKNREKRFTLVLAVVIGVFVLCWFPFFFTYSLIAICPKLCPVPEKLFKFFFWIGYCNSSLNPLIYTVFNQDFRKAFQKILCRGQRRVQKV